MKRVFLILSFAVSALLPMTAQVKVSVLGDSYSTFQGWIPEGFDNWYGPSRGNDVKDVSQTWWYQLIDDNGLQLEKNNSFSGSTICNTGYNGDDYTFKSFLTRSRDLGENPDIIFVFGGTNDSWANSPIGEDGSNDMYAFRPAARAMFENIKSAYPDALCVAIINSELKNEIVDATVEICNDLNVPYIQLTNIDKQIGHPSINGMKQISQQVWKKTAPLLYQNLKEKK